MIMGMIKLIFIISTLAMAPFGDESASDGAEDGADLMPQSRNSEAVAAYWESVRLDPADGAAMNGKGVAVEESDIMEELAYGGGAAKGYVIPVGPAKIVFAVGTKGMVGCGAFDVLALERFGYPAARVKPKRSGSIESLEDLLAGEVKDANAPAAALGVEVGMRGREALDLL